MAAISVNYSLSSSLPQEEGDSDSDGVEVIEWPPYQ